MPRSHCHHPKALCPSGRVGPRNPSPRARAQGTTLCPGVRRSCPGTRLAWLPAKAGLTPSGTQLYTHPQPGGAGVLSPRPGAGCCRSPPPLSATELAPYLVPPACFRGSCSHAWPSAGQPVHGLQEGSRVSGRPATQQPCLTGLCWLRCARPVGLGPGWDGAGRGSLGAAHTLPSGAAGAGGCLRAVLCRSRPGRHSSGLPRVRPQAVCSSLI